MFSNTEGKKRKGLPFNSLRVVICFTLFLIAGAVFSSMAAADDSWIENIRPDHPRLFFNRETWYKVKERALNQERAWYEELRRMVDNYPDNPTSKSTRDDFAYRKKPDGTYETIMVPRPVEWGLQAAHTAFVYLVTGDRNYLDKARKMLDVSTKAYHDCFEKGMTVNWYSTSRVHWLAAYDWIYNDLSPEERKTLMRSFIGHLDNVMKRPGEKEIYRLNLWDDDHKMGFYGDRNLVWFTGLAAYNDGINDGMALKFLRDGYRYNMDMFEYRKQCAGDDGGLASASPNYAMGAYPWSQFNFLYTWRSAMGEDVSADWPHLANFPVWVMWNWIPGSSPRTFGTGDAFHYDNALTTSALYTHMSQIMDFYADSYPDCAALASYIREIVPEKHRKYNRTYAFYPFLLTNIDNAPPPANPRDTELYARHFESLGQVFMRSGTGSGDTYCLFTIGSRVTSHKQHDENNFVIYKNGYLALDSGTRGRETGFQLRHYYSQTVAHNSILIHMPGEPFPGYWGLAYDGPEGQISGGGTNKTNGGNCIAFETNKHYTYAAGDATPCYSPEKCELALRQLVFVMPDYFVICDRVTSTDPDYRKEWLLHTQNEPEVSGKLFRANEEGGRMFCRTLYPKDAVLTKVGGQGREFWTCGKNWELAPEVKAEWGEKGLMGKWRMEVSPGSPRREDVFLHLIQTGDATLTEMCPAELIEGEGIVGVRFSAGNKTVSVTFATKGDPAGHITIASGKQTLIDSDLTQTVMPQAGLSENR